MNEQELLRRAQEMQRQGVPVAMIAQYIEANRAQAAPAPERPKRSPAHHLALPFASGALLDFGDEVAGGVGAAIPFGERGYKPLRNTYRALEERVEQTRPGQSKVARVAGLLGAGAITLPMLGPAVAGRGLLSLLGRGALTGAGVGAVQGAGAAEELSDVPAAAVGGAKRGAMFGAGGAVLAPALVSLFGGVPQAMQRLFSKDQAVRIRSRSLLNQAMEDAGMTRQQWQQALDELESVAPRMTVAADASSRMGRELRSSVNANARLETPALDILSRRQAGASSRLAGGLEADMGVTAAGSRAAFKQAQASLPNLAKRLYDPLEDMQATPKVAMRLAKLFSPDAPGAAGEKLTTLLQQQVPQGTSITFGKLQQVRADLRYEMGDMFATGKGESGRFLSRKLDELTDLMEDMSPGFKAANQQYRAAARMVKPDGAFALGAKALENDAATVGEMIAAFRKLSPETADAYRMGFLRNVALKLRRGPTARDQATALAAMGEETEAVFRHVFPTEQALQSFLRRARTERTFLRTLRATQANSTTAKQLADVGVGEDLVGSVVSHEGFWRGLGRRMYHKALGTTDREARGRIGDILLSRPGDLQDMIDQLGRTNAWTRGAQRIKPFAPHVGAVAGSGY